jgi:hypothetical protein
MALDLKAVKLTIPLEGCSITATRGLLEEVFGADFIRSELTEGVQVNRKPHSRRRRIGGPTTSVAGASYKTGGLSSGSASQALGGEAIRVAVNGSWWTMRLTGSHKAFNKALGSSLFGQGKVVLWRSEKGKSYGPFTSANTLNIDG